jgi:hypothetical protein
MTLPWPPMRFQRIFTGTPLIGFLRPPPNISISH